MGADDAGGRRKGRLVLAAACIVGSTAGQDLDEGPIAVPLGTQSAVGRVRGVYQLRGEVPAWKQQP
jgi:hypothetical protein